MKRFLAAAMIVMLFGIPFAGCSDSESATGPSSGDGNHILVVYHGDRMEVDLSYNERDKEVLKLVHDDQAVSDSPETQFVAFVWTGDSFRWRNGLEVSYTGGNRLTVSGLPASDCGNGYLKTADGQKYWLDLGQTDVESGNNQLQVEHRRHVICW